MPHHAGAKNNIRSAVKYFPPYKSFRGGLGEPFSKGSPIVSHRPSSRRAPPGPAKGGLLKKSPLGSPSKLLY